MSVQALGWRCGRPCGVSQATVMVAGVTEWRRSTAQKVVDRDGTRDRLATAMSSTIAAEIDRLSDRLNILQRNVGSPTPAR